MIFLTSTKRVWRNVKSSKIILNFLKNLTFDFFLLIFCLIMTTTTWIRDACIKRKFDNLIWKRRKNDIWIATSKQQQIDIQKFDISQTKTFRKMKNKKKKTMNDRLQYNEQKVRAISLTVGPSCVFPASASLSSRPNLQPETQTQAQGQYLSCAFPLFFFARTLAICMLVKAHLGDTFLTFQSFMAMSTVLADFYAGSVCLKLLASMLDSHAMDGYIKHLLL